MFTRTQPGLPLLRCRRLAFLPKQLKDAAINASVFPYGYNSDTNFSKAVTDIDDEAAMLLASLDGDR